MSSARSKNDRERGMASMLDPDGLLQIAEQMISVVDEKGSAEAAILDKLDAELFDIILACKEDHVELLTIIEDLQNRIATVERSLQEAMSNDHLIMPQYELLKQRDNLLRRERLLKDEERYEKLDSLNSRRESLQYKKESLKNLNTELQRNQIVLTLCASTFRIIPSDEGNNRVAGNLVDSKGSVVDTFVFDAEDTNAFEVCEKLWNLCMNG